MTLKIFFVSLPFGLAFLFYIIANVYLIISATIYEKKGVKIDHGERAMRWILIEGSVLMTGMYCTAMLGMLLL